MTKDRKRKPSRSASKSSALEKADQVTLQPNDPHQLAAVEAKKLSTITPEQLRAAFLTEDLLLLMPLLMQLKLSSHLGNVEDPVTDRSTHLYVVRLMESLGPRDAQERFLAMQMLATHTLAMDCLAAAQHKDQTDVGRDMQLNRGIQLMRLYATQMETWKQHRSKGEQRCTVEHVHVHSGAQAVVGTINQNAGSLSNGEESGKDRKSDGDK